MAFIVPSNVPRTSPAAACIMHAKVRRNHMSQHLRAVKPTKPVNANELKKKYHHLDVELGAKEEKLLRQLIEWEGVEKISKHIGVAPLSLMLFVAGFSEHQRPHTKQRIRAFFGLGGVTR